MGAFEYTALDAAGRNQKGVLEGDTPRHIRQQLRGKGWVPVSVTQVAEAGTRASRPMFAGQRRVRGADLALTTRQLATLVGSGLPVEEGLLITAQQAEKASLRGMLMAVRSRVLEGHRLTDALAGYPRVFPELYRATVAAGEQSGHLDTVLERLADYTESRQALSQRISLALIYPLTLIAVAVAVVALLLGYVVPQVLQIFEDIGQQLPWSTRALLGASGFVQSYGLITLAASVALVLGARVLLRREQVRERADGFLLRVPLLSRLIRGLNTGRFARTFSILTASGVPVLDGMRISAQVMSSRPMREAVLRATDRVREGVSLHLALQRSGYFPPLVVRLIASGEASGNMEDMLDRAARNQEQEFEAVVATFLKLFEPLLIIAMAGIVLFIVLAILTPIFELNQLVK